MNPKITLAICAALSIMLLAQAVHSVEGGGGGGSGGFSGGSGGSKECKDLNQVNCYTGKNEGNYCSSKDQTRTETRWFYDKGVCKTFLYKGCNGNRNRFCTKEFCERRCAGQ